MDLQQIDRNLKKFKLKKHRKAFGQAKEGWSKDKIRELQKKSKKNKQMKDKEVQVDVKLKRVCSENWRCGWEKWEMVSPEC